MTTTTTYRRSARSVLLVAPLALIAACGPVEMTGDDAATGGDTGTTPPPRDSATTTPRDGSTTPTPDAMTPIPTPDATTPAMDATAPRPDATTPRMDATTITPDATAPRPDATTTPPPDASGTGVWTEMLNAINAARAVARTCGSRSFGVAPPLTWNAQLAAAALGHSQVMAMTSCFSHDGTGATPCPDGTMCTRVVAAGYRYSTIGENIAGGQPSVAAVMSGWLASPGHCANIMNPAFREVGAGMARGGRYGIYWTQNFGAPGGASTCR